MSGEWTDEVSPIGASREPTQRSGRRSFTETISIGSSEAKPTESADREVETVKLGARAGRALSDNAHRMLANIDKHGTVDDAPPSAETPTAEVVSPPAAAVPAVAVPNPPSVTPAGNAPAAAAVAPIPDPAADHIARADRLTEHNRKLLGEIETLKAAPRHREPTPREKELDEIERTYLDSPLLAIRRLQALALGIGDPKSKEVDAEQAGVYQDMTEQELGVTLDESKRATRKAEQTRRLLERDKRDRRAETEAAKPADDPEARQAAAVHETIGRDLTARDHGKTYPLLMGLSDELHGMKPEALIWREIRSGIASGEFDSRAGDQQLIDLASRKIETQYQALADRIGKARPTAVPSTATPQTQASPATDTKAEPQGTGPRTITNASASVAPATPPAKKTEATTPTEQPKYRNEKERRQALADKHFPDRRS